MLILKLIQLVIGAIFCYLGYELRIRHNYAVLRGFGMSRNYSGLSKRYSRRVGRIFLFGGLFNLICAIVLLAFVPIADGAPVGTAHRIVAIAFAVGVAGLFLAILANELYNLRRYSER